MNQFIETLDTQNILRKRAGSYVLTRPVIITIKKSVINVLKSIYSPNRETGGILAVTPNGKGQMIVNSIAVVPNKSILTTAYEPDPNVFRQTELNIFNQNLLPLTFHTHPTSVGVGWYDKKNVGFYLKSSKPDRDIANNGVQYDEFNLLMPEMIVVRDERFANGLKVAVFEGGILPVSFRSLSRGQIAVVAVLVALLILRFTQSKIRNVGVLLLVLAVYYGYEQYRKPQYEWTNEGDLLIKILR